MDYRDYILNAVVADPKDLPELQLKETNELRKLSKAQSTFVIPNLPEVMDQGSLGSCVGCACKVVADMLFKKPMSVLWIWKNAKKYDQWAGESYEGTSVIGAGVSMKQLGVSEDEFYPYTTNRHAEPKSGALASAVTHKTQTIFGIRQEDSFTIMSLLHQGLPVATAIYVTEEFYSASMNGFIKNESNYLNTEKKGGHAMAIVGYFHKDGKLFWILRNSWGRGFGARGDVFISAELLEKISKGSFAISNREEKEFMSWWQRYLPWFFQLGIQFVINQVNNFVRSRAK